MIDHFLIFCAMVAALSFLAAYVWSFVLAWRINGAWLLGVVIAWLIFYPCLAYQHWPAMRRNVIWAASSIGLAIGFISLFLLNSYLTSG